MFIKYLKLAHLKFCELLENPSNNKDNQQPSLNSDVFEGSETRSESINLDDNSSTSAGQNELFILMI